MSAKQDLDNAESAGKVEDISPKREHDNTSSDNEKADVERHNNAIDLNNNLSGRIANPLAGFTREAILADVNDFAVKHQLEDILPLLNKGALVAANPGNYRNIDLLDDADKEHLAYEAAHKWSHPLALYITIITCSIGAAVQGWDQTGSNGANLSWPQQFGVGDGDYPDRANWAKDNWIVGLVNAGPYIGCAFIGCWISDSVNNYLGRRGAIFVAGLICLAGPIGGAFTRTWPQFLATRIVMGIGMGLKGATVPIFAAENSPAAIRGALVMSWQLWTAFGILLGFIANLAVYSVGKNAWRLQVGSAFIPAVPLVIGIFFCPESPRWYIKKHKLRQAYNSLLKLRYHELQAARDLYYIYTQIELEKSIIGPSSYVKRFGELFTIPRVRRATLASFVVMIAQQMCGINIIAFYSSTVFTNAGLGVKSALLASLGFGLVNFFFAFPAIWTIDTFGRRSLLLFTFPNMAWSLLATGFCFYIPDNAAHDLGSSKAHLGMIAFFIYIFAAFYSPGEGPVPFTYSAEVFPLSHREVGMGWAVATCFFWAAVLTITFPFMLQSFSAPGAFGFYAALNVIAFVMIFLFVPETKQRTLEELDYIFAVPTRTFAKYQVCTVAPHWFRKTILRQRGHTIEPLYHFEGLDDVEPIMKGNSRGEARENVVHDDNPIVSKA